MAKFVEMQVDSIRVHMPSGQHVVILKEKETERYLPIWIGIYEANAIALKITGITPERPRERRASPRSGPRRLFGAPVPTRRESTRSLRADNRRRAVTSGGSWQGHTSRRRSACR